MKRKLSKIGQSSLLVSLPHQWIKEHNLKKGDEVEVFVHDADLHISTQQKAKREQRKQAFVTFPNNYEKIIRVTLNDLYRTGYDRIVVSYTDQKILSLVRHIVSNYLLGFEIVAEEKERCIIEGLTEPTSEKADVLLRKVFFIIRESITILKEDIENNSLQRFSLVYELMMRSDRFCNFYSRTLFKENKLSPFVWTTVLELLLLEHSIYYCYKAIFESSINSFDQRIISFLDLIQKQFIELEALYYKKETKNLEKMMRQTDALLHKEILNLQKTKGGVLISVYLFDIVKTMQSARISILGTLIEQGLDSDAFQFQ